MTAAAAAPKPKVCILAPSYWPAVGGGETHARLLARELSVRGCAVTVLTRRREAEWAAEKKFEGTRILRFGKPGHVRLGKYLLLGPALWWLVTNKRRWDVVCVCGLRVAGWSGVLARKPCVLRAAAFLAVSTPVRDEYLSKGLGFLLRVWKAFHAMCPAAVLLLIGSGGAQSLSCEEDLRCYVADNGLGKSVRFTGYTDDVTSWLQASDTFVFASERESQGLAVLEAMACGLPVLASDIPGVRDMVRDGVDGHLLPPRAKSSGSTPWRTSSTIPPPPAPSPPPPRKPHAPATTSGRSRSSTSRCSKSTGNSRS